MKLLRSILTYVVVPQRGMRNEHWDIRFRRLRALQPWTRPTDLAKWRSLQNGDPAEIRASLKKEGFMPPPVFRDRAISVSTSGVIFDPYMPPESDGIASLLSKERAIQVAELFSKKSKSYVHVRKIRQYDPDFDPKTFGQKAMDIYIEAYTLLQNAAENEDRLHAICTEKAYAEMVEALRGQRLTLRWRFIESIDAARVVHVRTDPLVEKDNLFGQATVRFATRQALAIYDRFGRPLYGDEQLVRDVLEYVVFEKHVADEYGEWRLHGKLAPAHTYGASKPLVSLRTIKRPPMPSVEASDLNKADTAAAKAESVTPSSSKDQQQTTGSNEELTDEQLEEEERKLREMNTSLRRSRNLQADSRKESRS